MSSGEPLWRRVAGLYLSGVPLGGREPMSTRPGAPAADAGSAGDVKREVVLLGEALDLVTLAQGYGSPAVPLLLRALIRGVRELGTEPSEARAVAAAPTAPAADGAAEAASEPAKADAEAAAAATAEPAKSAPEEEPVPPAAPERQEILEQRVQEADRKVSALTAAVGQLVEVLRRRTRDGGGVDRRGFPRVPGGSAKLFVHGNAYQVVNWSRSGFLIRISEADRFSRGGFDFYFVLELPEETIQVQGRALPVRIERTLLAAEFAGLDEATGNKMGEIAARLASAPV